MVQLVGELLIYLSRYGTCSRIISNTNIELGKNLALFIIVRLGRLRHRCLNKGLQQTMQLTLYFIDGDTCVVGKIYKRKRRYTFTYDFVDQRNGCVNKFLFLHFCVQGFCTIPTWCGCPEVIVRYGRDIGKLESYIYIHRTLMEIAAN